MSITITSFPASAYNDANPQGTLILANGLLYGTTTTGGLYNGGTIFSYNLETQAITTIYSFNGTVDGSTSYSGVIFNGGYILYGSCYTGGTNNVGTIFSFDLQTETYSVLHQFSSATDGGNPNELTLIGTMLYGTCATGGSSNVSPLGSGTIFSFQYNHLVLVVQYYMHFRAQQPHLMVITQVIA